MSATRWTHAPAEQATWQAGQDAAQQVHADLAGNLHGDEVMAAHSGLPSIAEQSATHGAPLPAPDHGKG